MIAYACCTYYYCTPVAGQANKYDLNISGGEWYMASLSETNGYTGSTTEFLSYLTIYNTGVIITAIENPTTYNSFSNGTFSLSINLNGVGGVVVQAMSQHHQREQFLFQAQRITN